MQSLHFLTHETCAKIHFSTHKTKIPLPFLGFIKSIKPKLFCPIRPERAEAPSPGHRPGYNSNQQDAL